MSGIGTSAADCVVDPSTRAMRIRGNNWSRQAVTLNLSGHDHAPADLVAVVYRRGVQVTGLSAGAFTGTTEAASASLDLNTEELEERMVGLNLRDAVKLELQIWDSNPASLELIGEGFMEIGCSGVGYSAVSSATPAVPIVGSTGTLGAFGWSDGKIYFRNDDVAGPANWFPVSLQGAAGAMFIDFSQPGVALT